MPAPNGHWFRSKSALRASVGGLAAADPRFAGYFYVGPTVHFGHEPPRKKRKKGA
jgi:hypothetical protein